MAVSRNHFDKIVDAAELSRRIAAVRDESQSIVLCHGCFDIVHPGHIRHLEFARRHGDILIVSITGDAAIDKDSDRPYIPEELRAENLAALELVDLVYIDDHDTAADVLRAVRPDVYVKGEEYQKLRDARFLEEQSIVEAQGGRVVFSSGDIVFSSTELIRRLGRDSGIEFKRLQFVCQRHAIDRGAMHGLISAFAGRRFVVVGDVIIDRYVVCDPVEIAGEAPMLSLNEIEERSYVGGAAIVARHLAALGADVVLIARVPGRDPHQWVRGQLQRDGIELHSVDDEMDLVIKSRFVVEDTKLFKVDSGRPLPLDSQCCRLTSDTIVSRAAGADGLVFCDFGYGMITQGLLDTVLRPVRQLVPTVSADVSGPRGNLKLFRDVDLLCPNERELRTTLHDFDQGLAQVAWQLMDTTNARHLMTTLGRRGLVAFQRQSQDPDSSEWVGRLRSEYIQALCDHPVDVLGCGDALLAGASLALAVGANPVQAAYLGNTMAALESVEAGNIPISVAALRQAVDARPELEPVVMASEAHT